MTDGLVVLDDQSRIADMNRAARDILNNPQMWSSGAEVHAFLKSQPVSVGIYCDVEKLPRELVAKDSSLGKVFEVSCLAVRDRRGRRTGRSIIFHDVSERRMTEKRMLEQQRALVISEERERLARDLHDNLGQVLGFINVQAQAIKREMENAGIDIAAYQLERMVEVAQSAHQDMRAYIQNARRTAASERNLAEAIREQIEQYERQTGIEAALQVEDESLVSELAPSIRTHISYIAREALNNVRKHSRAKKVTIAIRAVADEIRAVIEDDGRGFDLSEHESGADKGLGLGIMKERAAEIGGQVEIDSAPGQGTRVLLRIPLNRG